MRYQSLAVLLGRLRSEDERARFATIYRAEARDAEAEGSLEGLLSASAILWERESARPLAGARAGSREVARVA
ncbi:MAG: hypothetical protein NVSMB65_11380 [Chloroflexota bacterium]